MENPSSTYSSARTYAQIGGCLAFFLLLYVFTAGFTSTILQENLSGRALDIMEIFYTPLKYLYDQSTWYQEMIDWQIDIASRW